MSDTIQVKYDELAALARQFAQIADRAQGVQKSLKSQVELVQDKGWQSPAATRFFGEMMDDVLPAFDRFYKAMAETQTIIQLIGKDFLEAEQHSESLIKDGESGGEGGPGTGPQAPGGDTSGGTYTVKPGDTLWDIAQKNGVTVDELVAANNIANRDLIHPGDQIIIPGHGGGGIVGGPAPVPLSGAIGNSGRSGGDLNSKIDGFNVASNQRYAAGRDNNPNTNDTYCNLYASDVAKSFGAPLPIFVANSQGGVVRWLGATDMKSWLDGTLNVPGASYQNGPQSGWVKMDHTQAAQAANSGHVVVVAGHGHMAVVRAGTPEGAGKGDVIISQAGARNFNSGPLKNGWGQWTGEAEFYVYKPQG